jgi:hypothetical protein
MRKIFVGLSVLVGLAIVCGQLSAGERVRRERRELDDDNEDLKADREKTRQDERERWRDRRDLRKDEKAGENVTGDKAKLKEDRTDLRGDASNRRSDRREREVDHRDLNQLHRINQGVRNGSLTPDEAKGLRQKEDSIEAMEKQFEGDGKLSRDESKQLNQQLNDASRTIFAEKHDTEGNQMSVYRLGKDVKLNPDVAQKLEDPNVDKSVARGFSQDFHKMLTIKRQLGTENLTDDQRAQLQNQYNDLLNKYFVVQP